MTVVVSYLPYPVVAGFLGSIGGLAKGGQRCIGRNILRFTL
jgi:MFS superfamily sulfate permease-like transporter